MPEKTPYSVRRATFPHDRQTLIDMWRGNLGDPDQLDSKYEWFYEISPTGQPLAMVLEFDKGSLDGGRQPVGVAAAGPRVFQVGDERYDAAVLVDLAVDKQHRTLFPALLLQKTLLAEGQRLTPLLYGFPNSKAAPVFQRAGYRKLGTIVRYVRVLRTVDYLRKKIPNWMARVVGPAWDFLSFAFVRLRYIGTRKTRIMWRDISQAAVGTVADTVSVQRLLRGFRTSEFLLWRFAPFSKRKFDFISVSSESTDRSSGYFVVEADETVLHVRDCSPCLLDGRRAGRALMLLFEEARRRGFGSVSFECMAPNDFVRTLQMTGMWPRSERPVFGVLRDDFVSIANSAPWYLTAADEDE